MSADKKPEHIEILARMAAELAGRDPNLHVRLDLSGVVAFDDLMWRYPDFLARAEAAYEVLTRVCLTMPVSSEGRDRLPPEI